MFRIKICGVTSVADALAAVEAGADAVGLNFFRKSPRFLAPKRAAEIGAVLPEHIVRVGVFVKPEADSLLESTASLKLHYVQLHGITAPEELPALGSARVIAAAPFSQRRIPELRRAIRVWRSLDVPLAALLLDADREGMHGGTGQAVDWSLAAAFRDEIPDIPLVLAGGLRPENVAEAIRRVHPTAVDVASGVESAPGIKDPAAMRRFVSEARSAMLS